MLDLLSAAEGPLSVRALLRAGSVLGFPENNVRVALCRLKRDGLVRTAARGEYVLAGAAERLREVVSGWRVPEARVAWTGAFVIAIGAAEVEAKRLRLLGFREPAPGFHVRPDNLEGGVDALGRRLAALGVGGGVVLARAEPCSRDLPRFLAAWDCEAIAREQHEVCARVRGLVAEFDGLRVEVAARRAFLVGGSAIETIVADPRLPDEMLACAGFDELVTQMRVLDRLGRDAWAEVLHGLAELGEATPMARTTGPMLAEART